MDEMEKMETGEFYSPFEAKEGEKPATPVRAMVPTLNQESLNEPLTPQGMIPMPTANGAAPQQNSGASVPFGQQVHSLPQSMMGQANYQQAAPSQGMQQPNMGVPMNPQMGMGMQQPYMGTPTNPQMGMAMQQNPGMPVNMYAQPGMNVAVNMNPQLNMGVPLRPQLGSGMPMGMMNMPQNGMPMPQGNLMQNQGMQMPQAQPYGYPQNMGMPNPQGQPMMNQAVNMNPYQENHLQPRQNAPLQSIHMVESKTSSGNMVMQRRRAVMERIDAENQEFSEAPKSSLRKKIMEQF